jgi:FkbM family methyltransferase
VASPSKADLLTIQQAWRWHQWNPRWLPRRARSVFKRLMLGRYRNPVLSRIFTDQPFLIYPYDSIECEVGLTGDWEGEIYREVFPLIPAGGTVIDAGCHVGYSTVLFGKAVGSSGHVYSFEPVAGLAEKARANVTLNHYDDRVEIVPLAVGDRSGTMNVYISGSLNTGMSSLVRRSRLQSHSTMSVVALDAWCDQRRIGTVDFVKIDIEGAEALALKGMEQGLRAAKYRALMIELHPPVLMELGTSARDVIQTLQSSGYTVLYWDPPSAKFVVGPLPDSTYILATANARIS